MTRILILLHECQRGRYTNYLIDVLAAEWQRWGWQVSCVYGLRERPEADILFPYIDLTHTPDDYLAYIHSFPVAVNRDVVDISKRRISANLLQGDEDYRAPVIVKTNNNFGGKPEDKLLRHRLPVLAHAWRDLTKLAELVSGQRLAWRRTLDAYPVYNSLAEVPACIKRNPALVIERFLPEREGDRYFMRHYIFLGDRARSVRVAGTTPFLKRSTSQIVDEGLSVPEAVLRLRRELKLDFGKIDYTMSNGEVAILDVNRTVGKSGTRAVVNLADGIRSLLPGQ